MKTNSVCTRTLLLTVLNDNKAIWNVVAPIVDIKNQIVTKMNIIRDLRHVQEKDTTGITVNKTEVKKNLITATFKVIAALIAHSIVTNNHKLRNSINYSFWDFKKQEITSFTTGQGLSMKPPSPSLPSLFLTCFLSFFADTSKCFGTQIIINYQIQ